MNFPENFDFLLTSESYNPLKYEASSLKFELLCLLKYVKLSALYPPLHLLAIGRTLLMFLVCLYSFLIFAHFLVGWWLLQLLAARFGMAFPRSSWL